MLSGNKSHEDFSREDRVEVGSEKSFALVFAVVFAIIAAVKTYLDLGLTTWAYIFLAGSVFFFVAAFTRPVILRPLNILWFRFGLLLHAVINPLVMGVLFFVTVTPVGLIMRVCGKRPLNLKFDAESKSYWIHREPPGPESGSFKNQF